MEETKTSNPKVASPPEAPEVNESASGSLVSLETETMEQELLENSPLRVLGYFGRLGRLAGMAFSKGSRYIAYSSDVGEAFRPVIDPKYVRAGYGVAIAYVIADIGLVTHRAYKLKEDYTRAFCSQTTFQVLGSLVIPSIVIHQGVHLSQKGFAKMKRFQKWGPVLTGLAMIPFMPVLIDEPVEHLVEMGFDKFWPEEKTPGKVKHE
ncbi:Mitochondrial fission process protein 1 [Hondaea fermentalgiana]|uniref:Mitochondrial fission process protein 1 n=1 Tax=Hondaea fermentalgiana TaxID=2315210 RepID=A0A2R5GF63_9STRA|nr:Mitochondrial fission process protein 1 [Hondaea fermentalgiana]|eukprot:GBG27263.1 Mitochondrial fission process protein 1 [Hondaea fermentalgiana]